jgi:hypothetical protein
VALDEFCTEGIQSPEDVPYQPLRSAFHLIDAESILASRRINRHFEEVCHKMKSRAFHVCDPGPLLLAPFVNDLGVAQAFETYGPARLRGREITNIALLNVFRILAGYRRINHLSDNRDRAAALASGVGMYGSTSRYYENTIEFKFEQIHKLRCDLVARAKELDIIEGLEIGFDFHFKEFYGKHGEEKQIGKGPDKAGDLVPGFRPHIAWDLAANVIITMAYFQGSARAPRILQRFCEQNIFPILAPEAVREIYMDSEYTSEGDFHYLKEARCKNGGLFICLKKNKQVLNFIQPALDAREGWKPYENADESKSIRVKLPKTGLGLTIVILRDITTGDNIRCFGATDERLDSSEILRKYRYRWLIENGIKDLVASYFVDEVYGLDPEKIEFEFYCVMVARLAYEYFLKELGAKYYKTVDGDRYTLQRMRNLLFEKRNCTIEQDTTGDFILTFLDSHNEPDLSRRIVEMYDELSKKGGNKVLWWNQRGIIPRFHNQYA